MRYIKKNYVGRNTSTSCDDLHVDIWGFAMHNNSMATCQISNFAAWVTSTTSHPLQSFWSQVFTLLSNSAFLGSLMSGLAHNVAFENHKADEERREYCTHGEKLTEKLQCANCKDASRMFLSEPSIVKL